MVDMDWENRYTYNVFDALSSITLFFGIHCEVKALVNYPWFRFTALTLKLSGGRFTRNRNHIGGIKT